MTILRQLPATGPLFPMLRHGRSNNRATEFKERCDGLNIKGVTLHSYRYAWAERARKAGYPERFAQEALGHNSRAVHRAYASRAQVKVPPLSEYERHVASHQHLVTSELIKITPTQPTQTEGPKRSIVNDPA